MHISKATRRASPLPSPHERLRVVGRGRGAFVRNCTTPTRRAAFRRRPTLPPASRGEGWCPQHRLCPVQRCVHALARKRGAVTCEIQHVAPGSRLPRDERSEAMDIANLFSEACFNNLRSCADGEFTPTG